MMEVKNLEEVIFNAIQTIGFYPDESVVVLGVDEDSMCHAVMRIDTVTALSEDTSSVVHALNVLSFPGIFAIAIHDDLKTAQLSMERVIQIAKENTASEVGGVWFDRAELSEILSVTAHRLGKENKVTMTREQLVNSLNPRAHKPEEHLSIGNFVKALLTESTSDPTPEWIDAYLEVALDTGDPRRYLLAALMLYYSGNVVKADIATEQAKELTEDKVDLELASIIASCIKNFWRPEKVKDLFSRLPAAFAQVLEDNA